MFLSWKILCQTLAAVTVVQASQSSSETKDRNGFNRRVIRPRGLNATTAESEAAIVSLTTSSHGSSVSAYPLQHVELNLLTAPVVQDCDSGNGEPVTQDCSCSTKQLAAQAISDAITMVQAVQEVWNDVVNQPILERYMGAAGPPSCLTSEASTLINGEFLKQVAGCGHSSRTATLANLAKVQEYQWLPYDTRWLNDYSGSHSQPFVYCATGVPPPQSAVTVECQENGPIGWAYTSHSEAVCQPSLRTPFT